MPSASLRLTSNRVPAVPTNAAAPGRIGAGASFHGDGLVTKAPEGPHLLIPTMKAHFLFAVASAVDTERQSERSWSRLLVLVKTALA